MLEAALRSGGIFASGIAMSIFEPHFRDLDFAMILFIWIALFPRSFLTLSEKSLHALVWQFRVLPDLSSPHTHIHASTCCASTNLSTPHYPEQHSTRLDIGTA
jgi:Na+-transporting NADH:ubiquinone oxidoreductase subunit NqrB